MSNTSQMEERIVGYLRHKLPEANGLKVASLDRASVGSSKETWVADVEWHEGRNIVRRGFVFRRLQKGGSVLRETEAGLEKETRILNALRSTPIPVPKVHWYETDVRWMERPFFVMEKIHGKASFDFPKEELLSIGKRYIELLAKQHTLDWESIGLSFLGVPSSAQDCALRELATWETVYRREQLESLPLMTAALIWLKDNVPSNAERISLNQGDAGPLNFLSQGGDITAVLDWEMAFLGDPHADIGWLATIKYSSMNLLGEWHALLERYESLTGMKVREESIHYYSVLAFFKAVCAALTARRNFCEGEGMRVGIHIGYGLGISGLHRFKSGLASLLGLAL